MEKNHQYSSDFGAISSELSQQMRPRSRSTSSDKSTSNNDDNHYRRLITALRSIKQKVALDPQSEKRCLCWSIVIIFIIIMIMTGIVVLIDWKLQHHNGTTNAYLVETLPCGSFDLPTLGIKSTHEELIELVNQTKSVLEITVWYWNLDPAVTHGFSEENLQALKLRRGRKLLQALRDAADRGVTIRVLQNYWHNDPSKDAELRQLATMYPENVKIAYWDAKKWYDGGKMHQKIWISDRKRVYIGSANMDWLSLSQVKELGVSIQDNTFGADTHNYFDTWWRWTQEPTNTKRLLSSEYQANLTVPCWSKLNTSEKCVYPLPRPLHSYTINIPIPLIFNNTFGGAFLSGSPQEVLGYEEDKPLPKNNLVRQGFGDGVYMRVWDQDGIVQTIRDAKKEVCLSVADFMPSSSDVGGHDSQPLWWPSFWDAILHAVNSKRLKVRLLISKWANTSKLIIPYLKALQTASRICRVNATPQPICEGDLQIKLFEVPGWNETAASDSKRNKFPPFSRYNNAKYLVTDRRINVGTSNMMWDYFYNTAGASFNCDHPWLRSHLQMVFDRDWNSDYATLLEYF